MNRALSSKAAATLVLWISILASAIPRIGALPSWGPLRPNIYAGMRSTARGGAQFGLMWYNADVPDAPDHIRHDCDGRDSFTNWNVERHNISSLSEQNIQDPKSGVDLDVSFVRETSSGAVVLRVSASTLAVASASAPTASGDSVPSPQHVGFVIYGFSEHDKTDLRFLPSHSRESPLFAGRGSESFVAQVRPTLESQPPEHNIIPPGSSSPQWETVQGWNAALHARPPQSVWDAKAVVRDALMKDLDAHGKAWLARKAATLRPREKESDLEFRRRIEQLPVPFVFPRIPTSSSEMGTASNLIILQSVKRLPCSFDLVIRPVAGALAGEVGAAAERATGEFALGERTEPSESQIDQSILRHRSDYDSSVAELFPKPSGLEVASDRHRRFARATLGHLLAGMGYFEGQGVRKKRRKEASSSPVLLMPHAKLLTCTPSRIQFPRGFLWDEGFHQLLVSRASPGLSVEVLTSWFDLVDKDGWIPREQILGPEARSRVPAEFQVQDPAIANPPTLLLALRKLVRLCSAVKGSSTGGGETVSVELDSAGGVGAAAPVGDSWNAECDSLRENLTPLWPKVQRFVRWYFKNQRSSLGTSLFRWKGRRQGHCLASGLDDYPRAPVLTSKEAHVDLSAWMVASCRAMADLGAFLGHSAKSKSYARKADELLEAMLAVHWDEQNGRFGDVYMAKVGMSADGETGREMQFVDHSGYVSLFPLALRVLPPNSPQLGALLNELADERTLWTPYGVRSLSRRDDLFGTAEDYWRGAIWMPLNYLLCGALHHYAHAEGPHAARALELYHMLRSNLYFNVLDEWEATGTIWEQYDETTGKGRRASHFTGWTSSVLLVAEEDFL